MFKDNPNLSKNLKLSFKDGIFASCMTGFTQEYLTPLMLIFGGVAKHIGMLNALPNLFASLGQLHSPDLIEKLKSRKKIITIFVLLQAVMLLPVALLALFKIAKPDLFIIIIVLFASCGAFATPAWGSLMSDLIPQEKRGTYFGWRNKTLGFVTLSATVIAGIILQIMRPLNSFYGFAIIFSFAFIFRLVSWYFLSEMREPPLEFKRENCFTIFNFLARIKESNFAKFVIFVSLMNFSVNIASPFFAVLMLKDLKFSYILYTSITVTATLTSFLVISRWGKTADKIGNLRIIKFVAPFIGFIPLLWIISRQPLFLFAAQVFSGFLWAGFNLCASNFIYDAVSPEKRTRCISYFNVLNGLSLCAGSLLGGFLLPILPAIFGYKILSLFLISSFLRIVIGIFMPLNLKEVRAVEKISNTNLFFSVVDIRPLLGIERKTIRY